MKLMNGFFGFVFLLLLGGTPSFAQNQQAVQQAVVVLPEMELGIHSINSSEDIKKATTTADGADPTVVCIIAGNDPESRRLLHNCGLFAAEWTNVRFRELDARKHPDLVASLLATNPDVKVTLPLILPVVYLNAPPGKFNGHAYNGKFNRPYVWDYYGNRARMTQYLMEQVIHAYTGYIPLLLHPDNLSVNDWIKMPQGYKFVALVYPDPLQTEAYEAQANTMHLLWGAEALKYASQQIKIVQLPFDSPLYGLMNGTAAARNQARSGQPTIGVVEVSVDPQGLRTGTLTPYDPETCGGLPAPGLTEPQAQAWLGTRGFGAPVISGPEVSWNAGIGNRGQQQLAAAAASAANVPQRH